MATCEALVKEKLIKKVNLFADRISAPMLVPKKPRTLIRVTIDLRRLNYATKKDARPMPNMKAILLQAVGLNYL